MLLLSIGAAPHGAAPDTLRIVLVVDDTAARRDLVRGMTLGAEEDAHTGALFGTAVALRVREARDSAGVADVLAHGAPSIVVTAGDSGTCAAVARATGQRGLPLLDAGCDAAGAPPAANVFVLTAPAARDTADSTRLELWHWSLERFGGEQLNQRFERRFGARMTSAAWAGWFAAKAALDLALRAHAVGGAKLLARLADPATQFDGQKGRPLRFAPGSHRLTQPLYRVHGSGDAERVVEEVAP